MAELPESARLELYREGELYPLTAGESVAPLLCDGAESVFIQLDCELEILIEDMAGHECLMLPQVFSLSDLPAPLKDRLQLEVRKAGRLLRLKREKVGVIGEELCHPLMLELVTQQGRWIGRLLAVLEATLGHRARLADHFYHQMMDGHQQLSESALIKKVIARVPRLPVSTAPLLARLLDEDSSRAEIAELVHQDPALASLLLKAINSPLYGLKEKISDVDRAIALIGFEGTYQTIMAEGLRRCLPNTDVFRSSYQRALELSHITYALARVTGKGGAAELSTIALLHDLGRVVAALMGHQNPSLAPLVALIETPVLGGELLKSWQLPERVWRTVASQHYPEFASPMQLDPACRERVAQLYVAQLMHGLFVAGEEVSEAVYLRDYMSLLGLDGMLLTDIWHKRLLPVMRARQNCLPARLGNLRSRASGVGERLA